jgi:predicted PurR-regulated permease PerM
MSKMNQHAAFSPIWRATLVTAALAVLVVIVKTAASIVAHLLLAAFIAIITISPLRWLTRKRVPKWLALSIIVIVLFEVGSILILVFTGELEAFSSGLPSASEALKDIFDPAVNQMPAPEEKIADV